MAFELSDTGTSIQGYAVQCASISLYVTRRFEVCFRFAFSRTQNRHLTPPLRASSTFQTHLSRGSENHVTILPRRRYFTNISVVSPTQPPYKQLRKTSTMFLGAGPNQNIFHDPSNRTLSGTGVIIGLVLLGVAAVSLLGIMIILAIALARITDMNDSFSRMSGGLVVSFSSDIMGRLVGYSANSPWFVHTVS
jgi:hypothetical protein